MRSGLSRTSLTRRLILLAAIWSLAVVGLTGVGLTQFFQTAALSRLQDTLSNQLFAIYGAAEFDAAGNLIPLARPEAQSGQAYSGFYWQIDEVRADGSLRAIGRSRSLFDTTLAGPPGGAAVLRARYNDPLFFDAAGPAGQRLRVAALMARLPRAKTTLVFLTAQRRDAVDEDSRRFAWTTAAALAALALGLILAVFVQVRFGLRPLFAMERELADVRVGRAQRLGHDYPSEIQPLADQLNALLDHTQEVVERQRTHVGNLAHALKTPLSVMLAEAEDTPGTLSEVVTRQAGVMREQVDHHLRRARAAARAQSAGERTEVAPVLDDLAVTLERIFEDKGIEIDWRAPEHLAFRGEKQDFTEIAGNIMENACKWGRRRVQVAALTTQRPGMFKLVIEDDGPGVPEDQRDDILERGARLDERTPGSGLGLDIVTDLASAYGGSVSLAAASIGGLRVELVLPAAII